MLLQLSHFVHPFTPLCPVPPPTSVLSLSSCPWVVRISSLAPPLILSLTFACLFCIYHLCFLFPVTFTPFSPLPRRSENPPCNLHFCDSVPLLIVCVVFVVFRFSFVNIILIIYCYSIRVVCLFSPSLHTTPGGPTSLPTSTLPLDLVHVSIIVVPVNPSPHCPLPTPPYNC